MIKSMKRHVGFRVTVTVNFIICIVVAVGGILISGQISQMIEDQYLQRGKITSIIGARYVGQVFDTAVDTGGLPLHAVFDTQYVEIPNSRPPKFHTQYDAYLDKYILAGQDEFLKDDSIVFAVAVDMNGYLPTHNSRFQKKPTGNPQVDRMGNRTKQMFNDPVGRAAAKTSKEGLVQDYPRDTGKSLWDISSPIYVKGRQWGGFRIGMSKARIAEAQSSARMYVIFAMVGILVVSLISVFFIVNRSIRPLSDLTAVASKLADGKIDQKVVRKSDDEIGDLGDALERLRVSLKVAMDRLQS